MKKNVFIILFIVLIFMGIKVNAADESYQTYNEITMVSGKLLRNFTDDEYEEYISKVKKFTFWGVNVYVVNKNVETTYISQTLYSVDNQGETDISYELDIVVETTMKTTLNVSGDLSGTAKGAIQSFKVDIAAKAGIDYSTTTTESKKETQKIKLTVEKNSRAIVYLMGNARITNGVIGCYISFINIANCGFEYFTLINQYPRMEKRKL